MKMRWLLLFIVCCWSSVFAQEQLSPLNYNPALQKGPQKSSARRAALTLPFADDFNQTDVYPKTSLWQDQFVFINSSFPILPPTIGVATFDGLNPLGKPYSDYNNSFGEADKLTSLPIDLSALSESDNVYLSFYWQAGGYGELPDSKRDYLTVQFLNADEDWVEIKRITPADTVNPFVQEFIPVTAAYLNDGFQFRFVAYGNQAGMTDHWHIDYVLLDQNRNPNIERSVSDLAYTEGNGKYFNNYYQMPFRHFLPEMLKDTLAVKVKNNFLNIVDIVDQHTVTNLNTGDVLRSYNGPSLDIASQAVSTYEYPKLDLSSLEPDSDTTVIEVKYSFTTSAENTRPDYVRANNQIIEYITFGNAFAYDDGSAERAYRLVNYDFGKIAVKFQATVADTLRAIRVYFPDFPNYTSSSKDPFFNVAVYKSLDTINGEDDEVLYREVFLKKTDFHVPEGEVFNGYAYYTFNPELNDGLDYLIVEGDFYIAIEHEKNNDVDVGFDLNHAQNKHMWYNVGYGWYSSQYPGSLMINAIMGGRLDGRFTSVKDYEYLVKKVQVYPNPTRHELRISTDTSEQLNFLILDISGKIIRSGQLQQDATLDVSTLNAGMYILQLQSENGAYSGYSKFIKH